MGANKIKTAKNRKDKDGKEWDKKDKNWKETGFMDGNMLIIHKNILQHKHRDGRTIGVCFYSRCLKW